MPSSKPPSSIHVQEFQDLLDRMSACFIERDFAAWRSLIILPISMVTKDGPVFLSTEEELRKNFDHYLTACDIMQLDNIYRRPLGLENCMDGTWIGTYETNLMRKNLRAAPPFTSSALLVSTDEGIKLAAILNARGHHEWTGVWPGDLGDH
ncbi:hypothetical protein [uncultured Roseobacter sp.]|uniref:hypothetical protein n=1 Tax=uncultured Roseobacter sp. TaxID=114847 RepID=UPI00261B1652|nr:hypothetical protein [uncultured Roseobacter sp.]